MTRVRKSALGQELGGLLKLRIDRSEKGQAQFLLGLAWVVNRYVFVPSRRHGLEQIYKRLYYDRRKRSFVRQVRKNRFEPIRASRVVSGYGSRKIEDALVQMLVDQVSGGKKGKRK